MNLWNSSKMDQNSGHLSIIIRNSRKFLFKTKEIVENSTFRKNKFPDLQEKVRNDKPGFIKKFNFMLTWSCVGTGESPPRTSLPCVDDVLVLRAGRPRGGSLVAGVACWRCWLRLLELPWFDLTWKISPWRAVPGSVVPRTRCYGTRRSSVVPRTSGSITMAVIDPDINDKEFRKTLRTL